jgi:hypothetical protein
MTAAAAMIATRCVFLLSIAGLGELGNYEASRFWSKCPCDLQHVNRTLSLVFCINDGTELRCTSLYLLDVKQEANRVHERVSAFDSS